MLVNDRVELQYANTVATVTSRCRLRPELCSHALNSRERSGSVYDKNLSYSFESKLERAMSSADGYFVSSIREVSSETLRNYIQNQG